MGTFLRLHNRPEHSLSYTCRLKQDKSGLTLGPFFCGLNLKRFFTCVQECMAKNRLREATYVLIFSTYDDKLVTIL